MAAHNENEQELKRQLWSELDKPINVIDWSLVIRIVRKNENAVRWRSERGTRHPATREVIGRGGTVLSFACLLCAPYAAIRQIYQLWPGAVNVADIEGRTSIHYYVTSDIFGNLSLQVLQLLTQGEEGRQSLNTRTPEGLLPIHLACMARDSVEVFQLLIERGGQETLRVASIHFENLPLHIACIYGQPLEVIKLLVRHYPESTRVRDNIGRLPIDVVRQRHQTDLDVIRWLEEVQELQAVHELVRNEGVDKPYRLQWIVNRVNRRKRRIDQV